MKDERTQTNNEQEPRRDQNNEKQPRSSAFKEPVNKDRKQTSNAEEEADLEQQRKEAMRERD